MGESKFCKVDIDTIFPRRDNNRLNLNCSACVPSYTHAYSIATEYATKWFLSHFNNFNKDFFKVIHIEGKAVLEEYRNFNFHNNIKKAKPALAILPSINLEHTVDEFRVNTFGLDHLMQSTSIDRYAFLKDYESNSFVAIYPDEIELRYTYKIRVESRAQQIDLFKYMKESMRIGETIWEKIDCDFCIPKGIINQLALDNGFEIVNDNIKNIDEFLKFVNTKSELPILFKYRAISGNMEYFIRVNDIQTFLDVPMDISIDDGERSGKLENNFHIEMAVTMRMTHPKLFIYYSEKKHELVESIENFNSDKLIFDICTINVIESKKINEKGWNEYLATEYYDEDITGIIEFSELLDCTSFKSVVDNHRQCKIPLNTFIDFKLYGSEKELSYTIDWDKEIIKVINPEKNTKIIMYVDTNYCKGRREDLEKINENRLK